MKGIMSLAEFTAFQSTARTIGCRKNFDGQVVADITLSARSGDSSDAVLGNFL